MSGLNDGLNLAFTPVARMTSASGSVGTTAEKAGGTASDGESTTRYAGRVIVLTNTHATQDLAWGIEDSGAGSSTITASGATTDGCILLPEQSITIPVRNDKELWVVGSSASTTYNVAVLGR